MSDANLENDVIEPPCSKKIKIEEQNENGVSNVQLELKEFVPVKVLNNNTNRKTVCIQGTFRDKSGVALVLLEKNAFKEEELDDKGYFAVDTKLRTFFQNDIYGNFECYPRSEINGVKTTIIYPATEKHIAKFSQQEVHIILETPELYRKLTLPYIEKEQFNLQMMEPGGPLVLIIQEEPIVEPILERDKDLENYAQLRARAKERKRRFLNNMTPEQRELKKAKDREYYSKKEKVRKKSIKEVPDEKKEGIRRMWRRNSKTYREKRRVVPEQAQTAENPQPATCIVQIQQCGPYLELVPVETLTPTQWQQN